MVSERQDPSISSRVEELRDEFGSLLDDHTLELIALDERGLLVTNKKNISELKDREEASLEVRAKRVLDTREFKKRDGGTGRVRNIEIEDDTGSCRLVLWDDDVNLPEELRIKEGSELRLTNCYVKYSDFGVDVSKGRKGNVEVG